MKIVMAAAYFSEGDYENGCIYVILDDD